MDATDARQSFALLVSRQRSAAAKEVLSDLTLWRSCLAKAKALCARTPGHQHEGGLLCRKAVAGQENRES